MNVLMYPLGTEDDFPDEFCAIRQGSGEHWFYTPVGEDASWMLFRALAENAKLRELVARLIRHIENPPCESCMAEMSCAGGEGLTNCDEYQFMVCDARELGVMDG